MSEIGEGGGEVISPLEGEMSPKATEGVAAREAPASFATKEGVGAPCETTASGRFAAISPSRGEIGRPLAQPYVTR